MQSLILPLPESAGPKDGERILSDLGEVRGVDVHLVLDFSNCKRVQAGAAWRISNAIRRFASPSIVEAIIPIAATPLDNSEFWAANFLRTGLGYGLSTYATIIRTASEDLTDEVRKSCSQYLEYQVPEAITVYQLHEGAKINPNDFDSFLAKFQSWLPVVRVTPRLFSRAQERNLALLCFEAIQNVWDHAKKKPFPPDQSLVSSFSMRFVSQSAQIGEASRYFDSYLEGLSAVFHGDVQRPIGFLEILVADAGVGLAARHSQDPQIYWRKIEVEDGVTLDAIRDGSSVKVRTKDTTIRGEPGYGFTYIIDSVRALHGYAALRTGRRLGVFNSTLDVKSFLLLQDEYGYMPGTVFLVVLPIIPKPSRSRRTTNADHIR